MSIDPSGLNGSNEREPEDRFSFLAIDKIIIGQRFRKDMGDLEPLASSILEIGLLHPIVVNEKWELIAGHRRLEACKKFLQWSEVPVHIVNIPDALEGEIDENSVRKHFTPSEIIAIKRAVEAREKELAHERMISGKASAESAQGSTRDRTAMVVSSTCGGNYSHDYLFKLEKIVESAENEPEKWGPQLRMVDEGKLSVNSAFNKIMGKTQKTRATKFETADPTPQVEPEWEMGEIGFECYLPYKEIRRCIESIDLKYRDTPKSEVLTRISGKFDVRTGVVSSPRIMGLRKDMVEEDAEMRKPREHPVFGLASDCEAVMTPGHTIVCGLTQASGKTTAVEGLVSRWKGKKILVFVCKVGEKVFQNYRKVKPFLPRTTTASNQGVDFSHNLWLTEGIQVMNLERLDTELQSKVIGCVAEEVRKAWENVILVIPEAWQILPRDRA